jgi:hypothetical protein
MENQINPIGKDKIEIANQTQIEKQKKLVGQIQLQRGHRLFQVNTNTGEIKEASYDTKDYVIGKDLKLFKNKSLTINNDCIYIEALNIKNVIKKLKRNKK